MNSPPQLSTPEDRYQFLLDRDVLVEHEDGTVATTEDYDSTKRVYHDTYADCDEETFHETIASLFELSVAEARDRIEELGVTRTELVAYLSLNSYLEADLAVEHLVSMAGMVAEVAPVSPVPDGMRTVTDDDYEAFLEEHPDAVVFVWRLHCAPCDAMKEELDEVLASIPDDVAVAGIDGENAPHFRRTTGIDAAPATATFTDGAFVEALEGRRKPERLATLFEETL